MALELTGLTRTTRSRTAFHWQGHGTGNGASGIQVIEFDPKGTVVWSWKQDPTQFSSIQGLMVLDGKDPQYLHVQETSTDSTWQPVVPTP